MDFQVGSVADGRKARKHLKFEELRCLLQVEQPQYVNDILRRFVEHYVTVHFEVCSVNLFLLGHLSKTRDTDRDDSESRPFQTPLNLVP